MSERQVKAGIAIAVIRDNKILLGLRRGSHAEGTWALPGGGLEYSESFEQCAQRELAEEAGMNVSHAKTVGCVNTFLPDDGKHYVTIVVEVRAEGEPEILEPDKCDRWEWFDIDNLPSPLFPSLMNAISLLQISPSDNSE